MSKRARRILVTLTVCVFAALIVWAVFYGKTRRPGSTSAASAANATQPAATTTSTTQPALDVASTAGTTATQPSTLAGVTSVPATAPATVALSGLRALAAGGDIASRDQAPQPLGSLDPRRDLMQVDLSRFGAGIIRIEFADIWTAALAKRDAAQYLKTLTPEQPIDPARLPQDQRYVLVTRSPSKTFDAQSQQWLYSQVPVMAVRWLIVDGVAIDMLNDDAWSETAPGVFESRIANADGQDLARVTRRYRLGAAYDIAMEQRVQNLSDRALQVSWQQYGPVDLPKDQGYIERYRLHFGYLPDPRGRPTLVLADDSHVIERGSAVKQAANAQTPQAALLWPNASSSASGWGLSWFGTTNRYFGLAVHPPLAGEQPAVFSLGESVQEVAVGASNVGQPNETLFTTLHSATVSVAPGSEQAFDIALYAGPLDREVLHQSAYDALAMHGMVIYSMGSCCAFLTFQWLAHLLLWFLSFLHDYMFFDWGLAIIGLVIVVRALLHPITKKSQINMQRLGRRMSTLKPEMDKIQKKFAGDSKKIQQENIRLMREHGVNPLQFLGCLTLFLQMPIWIALWAMLYLAFDIRQQPAFYGVFQMFWDWPFLADLSSEDSFIPLGAGFDIPFVGWHVGAINLLPILMGVVFFFQQKYMTPPTTANMTPEQIQQQKIMKWMTVVLFPVMMYPSPSGLTLYIMTSSIIGILESRYIRKHIDELDKNPPQAGGTGGPGGVPPKKPRGALGRAWAERLETIRQQAQQRQQEQRSFKKRK